MDIIHQCKIIQWNIRGLRTNFDTLKNIIFKENPDIIFLNETFLEPSKNVNICNYNILRMNRNDGRGGIATLIKKNIPFREIKTHLFLPNNVQFLIIKIKNINLCNIYVPPDVIVSTRHFMDIFEILGDNFILMGDLNAQNTLWGSGIINFKGRNLKEAMDRTQTVILNDGSPTRITTPSQNTSCPDLTIASSSIATKCSWMVYEDAGNSDHWPTLCQIEQESFCEVDANLRYKWNTKSANWNLFKAFCTVETPHTWDEWKKVILEAADKAIGKIQLSKHKLGRFKNPRWWNDECESANTQRRESLKKYKELANIENYLNYKRTAARSTRVLRSKKKDSFVKFTEDLNRNTSPGKVWRVIRRFSNSNNSKDQSRDPGNSWLEELIHNLTPDYIPHNDPTMDVTYGEIEDFTMEELESILESKKKDSAPGEDLLTYSIIKNCPINMKYSLLNVFNNIIKGQCQVPEDWKTAIVTPILKPGKEANNFNNYRPISLTNVIPKILEGLIKVRIDYYIESRSMFKEEMNGFRKGRGTIENITILATEIYTAFTNNHVTMAVFIDMSAAYDNVNINILKDCMQKFKINQNYIHVISQIIWGRKIYVRSNKSNKIIGPRSSFKGIQQGSPLSPVLFNIYTANFSENILNNVKVLQYADDIVIYCSGCSPDQCRIQMQQAINNIAEWMDRMEMQVSVSKTKAMLFSKGRRPHQAPLKYRDDRIEYVDNYKYLGMIFDSQMKWSLHISNICNKASKAINIMKALTRVWWGADPKILLNVYKSMVRTHFDYGIQAIYKTSKKNWNKINSMQFQALRIALGLMRSTPTNVLLSEAGEVPISIRRHMICAKFSLKHLMLENSLVKKNLLNFYSLYNEEPTYWRNVEAPCILEGLDLAMQYSEDLKTGLKITCYENNYECQFFRIDFRDSRIEKNNIHSQQILDDFINQNFRGFTKVYTDASVNPENGSAGIGIFSPDTNVESHNKLKDFTNICTAEIIAIKTAILIFQNITNKILIISDSKSGILKLKRLGIQARNDHITMETRSEIHRGSQNGINIKFIWVPSHSGIIGNEMADKQALMGREEGESISNKLHYTDLIIKVNRTLWDNWKNIYCRESRRKGIQYFSIQAEPRKKPWFQKINYTRRKSITVINRIRSAHCLTPAHLYKIKINDNPYCQCGETGDLNHIILGCSENPATKIIYNTLSEKTNNPVNILSIVEDPSSNTALELCKLIHKFNIKI